MSILILPTGVPVRGPSSDERSAWLEQRRQGVTATEVRDLRKGSSSERRRILTEKLTGDRGSFVGNRYTDHGNLREPIIAAWVEQHFGIQPNAHVWSLGRYLATPDGWDGEDIFEIKTSKHNVDPDGTYFGSTGYYDQVQWQLLVMGAQRCLFVWEQHDDQWPDPSPLHEVPQWAWIQRDETRMAELVAVADRFLLELDALRVEGLAPVGDIPPTEAELVHALLAARTSEAVAKAQKEAAWKALQEHYLEAGELQLRNAEAQLSVSVQRTERNVIDLEAFEAAKPAVVKRLQAAKERLAAAEAAWAKAAAPYTSTEVVETPKLTVTAVRAKKGGQE